MTAPRNICINIMRTICVYVCVFSSVFLLPANYSFAANGTILLDNIEETRKGLLLFQRAKYYEAGQTLLNTSDTISTEQYQQKIFALVLATIAFDKAEEHIAHTLWGQVLYMLSNRNLTWQEQAQYYTKLVDTITTNLAYTNTANNHYKENKHTLLLLILAKSMQFLHYQGPVLHTNTHKKTSENNTTKNYFPRPLSLIEPIQHAHNKPIFKDDEIVRRNIIHTTPTHIQTDPHALASNAIRDSKYTLISTPVNTSKKQQKILTSTHTTISTATKKIALPIIELVDNRTTDKKPQKHITRTAKHTDTHKQKQHNHITKKDHRNNIPQQQTSQEAAKTIAFTPDPTQTHKKLQKKSKKTSHQQAKKNHTNNITNTTKKTSLHPKKHVKKIHIPKTISTLNSNLAVLSTAKKHKLISTQNYHKKVSALLTAAATMQPSKYDLLTDNITKSLILYTFISKKFTQHTQKINAIIARWDKKYHLHSNNIVSVFKHTTNNTQNTKNLHTYAEEVFTRWLNNQALPYNIAQNDYLKHELHLLKNSSKKTQKKPKKTLLTHTTTNTINAQKTPSQKQILFADYITANGTTQTKKVITHNKQHIAHNSASTPKLALEQKNNHLCFISPYLTHIVKKACNSWKHLVFVLLVDDDQRARIPNTKTDFHVYKVSDDEQLLPYG